MHPYLLTFKKTNMYSYKAFKELYNIDKTFLSNDIKVSILNNIISDIIKKDYLFEIDKKKLETYICYLLESFDFDAVNIHLHVPEGAIPKDGPSAGITMATSIASALTHRKVKERVAMTGEITLRGKVLPVGGIKEKILAAKRAGITEIILSSQNEKDIDEIGEMYLKGVSFKYVNEVSDVISYALLKEKAMR